MKRSVATILFLLLIACTLSAQDTEKLRKEKLQKEAIQVTINKFLIVNNQKSLDALILTNAKLVFQNGDIPISLSKYKNDAGVNCFDLKKISTEIVTSNINIFESEANLELKATFRQDPRRYFVSDSVVIKVFLREVKPRETPSKFPSPYLKADETGIWRIEKVVIPPLTAFNGGSTGCLSKALLDNSEDGEDGKSDRKTELQEIFDKAKSDLEDSQKSLELMTLSDPKIGTVQKGFYQDEVIEKINTIHDDVLKALKDEEFDGLRNQVANFFPSPELQAMGIKNNYVAVTEKSVESSFKKTSEFLEKLEKASTIPQIVLSVIINDGEKDFASFQMWVTDPSDLKSNIPITGSTDKLYPGSYYHYKITKEGFKDIEGDLNLLNDIDKKILVCTMRPITDTRKALPCERK
jgi:hypothetical protein